MLLSLCSKNLPRMFAPSTRCPLAASMLMMVFTVSYSTALPAMQLLSVFVAICASSPRIDATKARRSPSASLLSVSCVARRHSSFSISTWRNGSGTPPTLYSLLKPLDMITFIFLMRRGTSLRNFGMYAGFFFRI